MGYFDPWKEDFRAKPKSPVAGVGVEFERLMPARSSTKVALNAGPNRPEERVDS